MFFMYFCIHNILRKMKLSHIIFILACVLVCGCKENTAQKQLNQIDTLLSKKLLDSAKVQILRVDTSSLSNEETAYYNILNMIYEYRTHKPKKSYTGIDKSIVFYEDNGDAHRLARACFVKGASLLDEKKTQEGLVWLKKAEEQAKGVEDAELHFYINGCLAYVNHVAGNFRLALSYGKKALHNAIKIRDKEKIGHAYNITASSFLSLGKRDSAFFYIDKGLRFAKFLTDGERNNLYNNAALIYEQAGDTHKAKELLKQSLAFCPNANAYGTLAQVYSDEGKDDSAALLWEKALRTNHLRQKISFMKSYAKWQKRNGKYEEASATSIKAAELKDSLARQQQAEVVKEIQDKYDMKVKEGEAQRWIIIFLSAIIVILIASIIISCKYIRTRKKERQAQEEIAANRMMIADYTTLIKQMKESGKEKSAEVRKLQRKLDMLYEKQAEIIYNGRCIFEDVKNGKGKKKWTDEMFGWFVEYYRTINYPFIMHLEHDYKGLSYMNMAFLILYEIECKDDLHKLGRIMGMEDGAMRVMKSRINKKLV